MTARFVDNAEHSRFEYHVGDAVAYANYRVKDGSLYIDKVEAPVALRGTGAASALMQHIVDHAREQGLNVVPVCPYAVKWLQRGSRPPAPKP